MKKGKLTYTFKSINYSVSGDDYISNAQWNDIQCITACAPTLRESQLRKALQDLLLSLPPKALTEQEDIARIKAHQIVFP